MKLRELSLDGGVSVQPDTGEGVVPQRRVALHLSNPYFNGTVSWWDPSGAPATLSLSFVFHAWAYQLHGSASRQMGTGQLTASGAVMTFQGPLQAGLFVGGQSGHGLSAGLLTMMVF